MRSTSDITGHVASLDILRAIGAGAVLFFHYLYNGAMLQNLATPVAGGHMQTFFSAGEWFRHAYLGVHLFFMVSGFVIMASAAGRTSLAFAIARFTRLWPTFALCVTITALVSLVGPQHVTPAQWSANLTFLAPAFGQPFTDGVYWTIVVEIVFYAWVALAISTGVLERHLLLVVAAWLALSGLNELVLHSGAVRIGALTRYAPWFAMGVLFFHGRSIGWSASALALFAAALALSFHNVVSEQAHVAALVGALPDPLGIAVVNAAVVLVFALALRVRLRATPALVTLGALTYPLYLLHQHIGYALIDALAPATGKHAALAITTAAMIALAWAITRRFDSPARRLVRAAIDTTLAALHRKRLQPAE